MDFRTKPDLLLQGPLSFASLIFILKFHLHINVYNIWRAELIWREENKLLALHLLTVFMEKVLLNFSEHFDYSLWGYYQHSVKYIPLCLAYIMTVKFQLQRYLSIQWLFNYLLENNFWMWQGHEPSPWVCYIYFFLHLVYPAPHITPLQGKTQVLWSLRLLHLGRKLFKDKTIRLQIQH